MLLEFRSKAFLSTKSTLKQVIKIQFLLKFKQGLASSPDTELVKNSSVLYGKYRTVLLIFDVAHNCMCFFSLRTFLYEH